MPLICNLWPRCRHVQWRDEKGAPIEPTLEMLPTIEVAVYPWRCQTCADLGYPYYVPRGSHLTTAGIAAESEFRAARPGDSFEEVFRKADLAAFYEAPKDDYHEGPLGGWGPGAGWNPEIPERDISSTASPRAPNNHFSTTSPNHTTSTKAVDGVSLSKAPRNESTVLPTNNSSQTVAPATSQHREVIDLTAEDEEVSCTGSRDSHVANSPQSSGKGSGYLSGANRGAPDPVLAAISMGLTLVVNGVTYPRIENGKERWYTQRPGCNNNYSRYSDLAKFDTSKGVRVAPKASRAQLEAARRYRTFG
ncbi:hypothetical protein KCV07_g5901, partial [Aureobasidium melanogenum]